MRLFAIAFSIWCSVALAQNAPVTFSKSGGASGDYATWTQNGYRVMQCQVPLVTSTAYACNMGNATTSSGTNANGKDNTRNRIKHTTAAGASALAGPNSATAYTQDNWKSKVAMLVKTDASVANQRLWFGLTEASVSALATIADGASAASLISLMAVSYDTGVDSNFQCCSGDGTNYSCNDMGLAPAANTEYYITVDSGRSAASTVTCKVQIVGGASVTTSKATNVANNGDAWSLSMLIVTRDATAQSFYSSWYEIVLN